MNPIHPTIAWLTWRQLFAHRRLFLALAFALTPVVITLLFTWLVTNAGTEGTVGFFNTLQREIVVGTILPVAAVVFGTYAFGGEVDDGTLVYLLVKPVARWRVVLSKYVVAALSTVALMALAIYGPWLVLRMPELPAAAPTAYFYGAALGAALYAALFVPLGVATKRSLLVGLLYVVAFEMVLSRSIPGVRSLSVREFANAVTLKSADPWLNLGTSTLATATIRNIGALMLFGGLAYAIHKLRGYQMAERV